MDTRWAELDSVQVMGAILQDVLRSQGGVSGNGRGKQAAPTPEAAKRLFLRMEMMEEVSFEPFAKALRDLAADAGDKTGVAVAERCGWKRTTTWRLMNGYLEPTMAQIAAAATAYGREPAHFREYRADRLAEYARAWALANPEACLRVLPRIT